LKDRVKRIVVTGGGSGGHIIPTLAVVDRLKELDEQIELLYIGSRNGMEAEIVPQRGLAFKGIYCGKLRRYFSWENFTDVFRVFLGILQSFFILLTFKPEVIFSKGGYVTVPVGLAGGILGIPLVVHESDTVLGLSNKILKRFAKRLCLGFPEENYPSSVRAKGKYTGSPVNPKIFEVSSEKKEEVAKFFGLEPSVPILFVTGGSQGARAINQTLSAILEKLLEKIQIIHQCGKTDYPQLSENMEKLPEDLKKRYKLFDFFKEVPEAFLISDLVFTRGGANTLSEIMILKKPSIIIPLPKAANDHQRKNGKVLSEAGAALLFDQSDLTPDLLFDTLSGLLADPEKLKDMSDKAGKLSKPDAALSVAKTVLELAGK